MEPPGKLVETPLLVHVALSAPFHQCDPARQHVLLLGIGPSCIYRLCISYIPVRSVFHAVAVFPYVQQAASKLPCLIFPEYIQT